MRDSPRVFFIDAADRSGAVSISSSSVLQGGIERAVPGSRAGFPVAGTSSDVLVRAGIKVSDPERIQTRGFVRVSIFSFIHSAVIADLVASKICSDCRMKEETYPFC